MYDNTTVDAPRHSLLTSLPTELLVEIIELSPPDSHLNIALSCSRLADCAHDVLARHRLSHIHYRVTSDCPTGTVITLLRSVFGFGDPIPAWHVRSFECHDDRRLQLQDNLGFPPREGLYRYDDGFHWKWHEGEVDTYLRVFEEASLPSDVLDDLRRDIRNQHDGALKMMLFFTLPRLRDIKLLRSPRIEATDSLARHEPYPCLAWLQAAIENNIHQELHIPGLRGLESLAIGVETGEDWPGEDPLRGQPCLTSARLLLQLLRLPRLSSLYLHGLSTWDGFGYDFDYSRWQNENGGIYDLIPGSSALEHLYLDGIDHFCSIDFVAALAAAPSALKTVALRADDEEVFGDAVQVSDIDSHIGSFLDAQRETLESMMVYSPDFFMGNRSALFDPHEIEDACEVRQFSHDVWDHIRCVEDSTRDAFVEYFCRAVSSSLEVLVLHGFNAAEELSYVRGCEDPVDEAVAALLDSGNHSLKTIYLCGFEGFPVATGQRYGVDVRFQKAIVAGIRCGVDVITRTTRREDLINPEPSFPRAVGRYDLVTGRFGNLERPAEDEGRLFDPVSGTRQAELCDHCGECDECLAIYPRELWEKAREVRAWAMRKTELDEWLEPESPDDDDEDGDEGEGNIDGEDKEREKGAFRAENQVMNSN